MSGWIQTAMQQNTISSFTGLNPNEYKLWKIIKKIKMYAKTTSVNSKVTLAKERSGGIATIFQSYLVKLISIFQSRYTAEHSGRSKSDSLNK